MYQRLEEYLEANGNSNVPQRYVAEDGLRLGRWVNFQRASLEKLPIERKEKLELLQGWQWAKPEKKWEEMFECLKEYVKNNGNANVP